MGTEQLGDAEGQMNAAYSNLMAMVENYPELKANTSFMHIQEAICDIENTIQATRRSFNQAVSEYNTRIEIIPSCYVAKKLNIRVENYFEADEIKKEDIELKY